MKFTQLIPVALSLASTTLAQSFCSSATHSGESVKETSNKVGSIGGVGYELWADSGNNSATFYSDGSFSCTFQSAGDYLCRSGLSFDSTKTPDQIGRMKADFKLVKQNISNVGYSYVGVYGWTRDPLVEYYIVDNWLSPSPPGDWVGNQKHGAFTIDGAQYTVYENTRTGPSIDGDTTFKQYFSIRQQARDCGTIDISAHFDQWEKLGMKMGKLHEAKVLGEAGNGSGGVSGTADFPYAKVYIGDGNGGGEATAPAQAPPQPPQGNDQQQAPQPPQGNEQQQAPQPPQGNDQQQAPQPPQGNEQQQAPQPPQGNEQQQAPQPPQGNDQQQAPPPPQGNDQQQAPQPPQSNEQQQQAPQPPQGNDQQQAPQPPQSNEQQQQAPQPPQGNDQQQAPQPPQGNDQQQAPQPPQGSEQQQGPQPPQGSEQQQGPQPPQGNEQQQAPPVDGNCASIWGQCGGQGFNGPTCCSEGTCKQVNEYFHQCQN
ncbi:concanavalin A-like lectin/glucanase [Neocallimastix californiae]|uniref:endo-1,4-beta-xylanase n=1 Tax=Neocallimastix californiae TaxID=1754190 RepID=A0A1Y2AD58_9FUNG|nr:concanavalin A-like lectin/glucanase [Neocallimastix californiae]|eukprot:ORY20499.1 concanavalin A-like lectin/glucanase [Neocallimastix californiae]